jgi:hypothetical protein
MSSLLTLALKSPNKIFIWCFRNFQVPVLVLHRTCLLYCDVLPKKPANQRFIARQQLRRYAIVDEAVFSPCLAESSRPEPRRAEP